MTPRRSLRWALTPLATMSLVMTLAACANGDRNPLAGSSQATLTWPNPDPYQEDICQPVPVTALRIDPPDETTALITPVQQRVCSAKGTNPPEIGPVTQGARQ